MVSIQKSCNAVDRGPSRTTEPLGTEDGIPVLPAYRFTSDQGTRLLKVWCWWCRCWHQHGDGDGHRVAHCHDRLRYGKRTPASESPYDGTGYILRTVGDWSKDIDKAVRMAARGAQR